jgi:hypothetical protein
MSVRMRSTSLDLPSFLKIVEVYKSNLQVGSRSEREDYCGQVDRYAHDYYGLLLRHGHTLLNYGDLPGLEFRTGHDEMFIGVNAEVADARRFDAVLLDRLSHTVPGEGRFRVVRRNSCVNCSC